MRDIIRKVLRESISPRFTATFHQMLESKNAKKALLFGVHPDDWYLGTQIEYKWRKSYDTSHCVFYGSPDLEVAKELVLFNPFNWNTEEDGYKLYCDMINQYYDLDNFEIPNDDKTIYAYLDRVYNLVNLGGYEEFNRIEKYKSNPKEHRNIFGYEYNDYDEGDEIGVHHLDLSSELTRVFKIGRTKSYELLDNWTMNKVLTDNYRDI